MRNLYLKCGILENKFLIGAFILGVILQVGVLFIPSLANIFKLTNLNKIQWLCTIAISISPLFIMEIQKKFNEVKFGKTIYKYKEKFNENVI